MTVSPYKAKKLARTLLRANRDRTWRTISIEDYGGRVHYATLNKIANKKGTWLPTDETTLIALGLMMPRKPKPILDPIPEWLRQIRKRIAAMARQTRSDLGLQK